MPNAQAGDEMEGEDPVRVGFLLMAPSSVPTWAEYFEWLLPAMESLDEPHREREHRKDVRRVRYQLEALRAYRRGIT